MGLIILAYVLMSSSMLVINKVSAARPASHALGRSGCSNCTDARWVVAAGGDVPARAVRGPVRTAGSVCDRGCGAPQGGVGGDRCAGLGQGARAHASPTMTDLTVAMDSPVTRQDRIPLALDPEHSTRREGRFPATLTDYGRQAAVWRQLTLRGRKCASSDVTGTHSFHFGLRPLRHGTP